MTRSITQNLVDGIHTTAILNYDLCASAQQDCVILMDKKLTLNFDSLYPLCYTSPTCQLGKFAPFYQRFCLHFLPGATMVSTQLSPLTPLQGI